MMSEEQFTLSQNECASMLGMTLSEYQKYCKDLKVPKYDDNLFVCDFINNKYFWLNNNLVMI